MARLPRFVIRGQPQHVIQRGNNRQDIFRAEDDYHFYLEKLNAAAKKHQCDVHAYVLMTSPFKVAQTRGYFPARSLAVDTWG
jgi:putative transposase